MLTLAVCKIRSFLVDQGYGHRVNYKNFVLHALFFCLLILSLLVFYVGFALTAPTDATNTNPAILVALNTVYVVLQFVDQVLLIVIFLRFSLTVAAKPSEEVGGTGTNNDSDFDYSDTSSVREKMNADPLTLRKTEQELPDQSFDFFEEHLD